MPTSTPNLAHDPRDVEAITAIVERWDRAFAEGEAGLIAGDYADDADWTNAFGVTLRGAAAIAAFLQERLFQSGLFAAARITPAELTIRWVRPDVAVVHSFNVIRGQRTPSGDDYPERRVHHQRVVTKDGGRWRVVAHLISDENARPA